ncbi:hypothetical protein R83H12_01253 [Fibrobacteria bacterium R8-3-H12]
MLKSDYITNGSINRLGNLLTLKVELRECEKKQSLGDFTGEAPDLKGPNKQEYEYDPAKYDEPYNDKYKKVKDAKGKREAAFITSGVLLLSGVMVHVWF